MSYKDLIIQEGEYTYSANIQYDMESDSKLLKYIPNETTIQLFKEIFSDVRRIHPNNHARILYGSYGTGKSHFLTVFGQILSKTYTEGIAYKTFLSRVNEYNSDLVSDIDNFISDKTQKPFLVVPIVFDFDDFNRCIYFSLKKKLDSLGISIRFKSFYLQALELLSQWRDNEESCNRLCEIAKKKKFDIDKLVRQLELFDPKAEKNFNKIFESMTYGVKYVNEASNMSDILDQTNEIISQKYSGIVFIFDEFGRYIEDNLRKIKVKAVQDFAEYCDHGSGNNHIILVSHKEISQYTENCGKKIASEWKKVEGRYKASSMNSKQDQYSSIIRSVLIKNEPVWTRFVKQFKAKFNEIYDSEMDNKSIFASYGENVNPFELSFPLHPITLLSLDRLSKKVAQNDRTFFTYLASNEPNSLYRFLIKNDLDEFHYIGVNEIFDYFEDSIKSVQSDNAYEWYKQYEAALSKGKFDESADDIQIKVLKVLTTFGIINDSSVLSSNKKTIVYAIDLPEEDIIMAIDELCEKKIIKYSGVYDRYEFFDASIFDVEEMIAEESVCITCDTVVNTLNEKFVKFVLYPHKYNHTYKINRVFIPIFSTDEAVMKPSFLSKLGHYYDGALIMVVGTADTLLEKMFDASNSIHRSILWVNQDSDMLVDNTKKYIAAKYLESQKSKYISKDPAFEKELNYHIQELAASIETYINDWISFNISTIILSNGKECSEITSFALICELASEMMFDAFPNALIVNNELINKNNVSGSIATAKKNAIRAIISDNSDSEYYGLQYLSPDYIAVRSVLCKNGFAIFNDGICQNSINNDFKPQDEVKKVVCSFINKAQKDAICFNDLYVQLKNPPFGLRDGYLSLIIACVLMEYGDTLVISIHGKEQEITAELFEEMIKRPNDYTVTVALWSKAEMEYISALESLFEDKIAPGALSKNRLKAIYEAMLSHYKGVSKFSRTTMMYVSESTMEYRKLLEKNHSSYTKFFFEDSIKLTGDLETSFEMIKNSKNDLDNAIYVLFNDLKSVLSNVTGVKYSNGIGVGISELYNNDWQKKRIKSFDYYTNVFLDYAEKINVNLSDETILSQLGKLITGIEVTYWSDNHRIEFENKLTSIYNTLISYSNTTDLKNTETKMTLTTSNGQEKTVVFDNSDLSDLGKTIKNKVNATFGNFGLAISYEDKIQILLSLLNDLMEGK